MTKLEDWEIALIKAMKASGRWPDQAIHAVFSTPARNFHSARLSMSPNEWPKIAAGPVPAASPAELARFETQLVAFGPDQTLPLYSGNRQVFQVEYHFMPVGQGLFAASQLQVGNLRPFRWVYDCGTISPTVALGPIIAACPVLAQGSDPKAVVDILALSHFHEDHISGISDLMQHCQVRWLLLPYLTPWERLHLLFQSGAEAGSDYGQFLRDPAGYAMDRWGVGQVILVQPGGAPPPPSEPPPSEPPEDGSTPDRLRDDWKLLIPASAPSAHVKLPDPQMQRQTLVLLPAGGALVLSALWEFVPYCDKVHSPLFDATFMAAAEPLAARFVQTGLKADLDALRRLYDAKTATPSGKPSFERQNHISLHLYAGPIGAVRASDLQVNGAATQALGGPFTVSGPDRDRIGQLLTGDADFNLRAFNRLRKSPIGTDRLRRGAVFQVPHHGSIYNWRIGTAAQLAPRLAVFSSDDTGFRPSGISTGHPHQQVWQDFSGFARLRVNLQDGCMATAAFAF